MIGDDLELLQKGTGYLGNKVLGPGFDQTQVLIVVILIM